MIGKLFLLLLLIGVGYFVVVLMPQQAEQSRTQASATLCAQKLLAVQDYVRRSNFCKTADDCIPLTVGKDPLADAIGVNCEIVVDDLVNIDLADGVEEKILEYFVAGCGARAEYCPSQQEFGATPLCQNEKCIWSK